jgi:hypothetical protein
MKGLNHFILLLDAVLYLAQVVGDFPEILLLEIVRGRLGLASTR